MTIQTCRRLSPAIPLRLRILMLPAMLLLLAVPAPVHAHPSAASLGAVLVHVEPAGIRIWPTNPSLTRVRPGQTVQVVLYTEVIGLTRPVTAHVALDVRRGGASVFSSEGTFPVTRAGIGGYTRGWRWYSNTLRSQLALPGRYTFTGTVQMAGLSATRTTSFSVGGA